MKVKLELNKSDSDLLTILLSKGKDAESMHSKALVGFYPHSEEVVLQRFIEDLNNTFERMWH